MRSAARATRQIDRVLPGRLVRNPSLLQHTVHKWIGRWDRHLREVITGAGIALLLRVFGTALQFGFSVLIARYYGPEGLGIYMLSLSCTVIVSVVGRWGLDQTALKLVSIHANRGEWNEVRYIQLRTLLLTLSLSTALMLPLVGLAPWLAATLFQQVGLGEFLQMLVLASLPLAGLNVTAECLRSIKQVAAYTIIQSLLVPLIAVVCILILNHIGCGLRSAAYAYVSACYLTFFAALGLWWTFLRDRPYPAAGTVESNAKLFEIATPMAWIAILGTVMSFSETLLLGAFRPPEDIGIYSAALRLSMLASFIVIAFNAVLGPKFAALIHENKIEIVQDLARRSARMMTLASLPILVVFILFPDYTLLAFGTEFPRGSGALAVLGLAHLFNVALGPAGLLLTMGGHEKRFRNLTFYAWLLGGGTGFVLIPAYGAVGAACSAAVGIVLLNVLSVHSVKKEMGITLVRL